MSQDTTATVIINAADQAAAKAFLPDTEGCFNTPASADGNEPATHYFTQGWWANDTLNLVIKDIALFDTILGTDWKEALASKGLQMIVAAA